MECSKKLSKRYPWINFSWLPIKAHYFLMFGGVAGVTPFLTVLGKDLGLSATAVGIVYTVYPISVFLCKPLFGLLADYIRNTKALIVALIIAKVVLSLCILLINPINKDIRVAEFQCIDENEQIKIIHVYFDEACVRNLSSVNETIACSVVLKDSLSLSKNYSFLEGTVDEKLANACLTHSEHSDFLVNSTNLKCFVKLKDISNMRNRCKETNSLSPSFIINCDNEFESCLASSEVSQFYNTYQFWVYLFIIVTSCVAITTAISLSDVSCYELLGDKKEFYGRQRLWGTASTGIITLFSGYLNDKISKRDGHAEYLAGFYVMIALSILNMILLANMKMPKANTSSNLMSDIFHLFRAKEFIAFTAAVFVIGTLHSLNANYLFWYLTDLGAHQTLLGLTITMQCLAAEVPFFFFSGIFIKYLGYFNCLTCSFAAFALRFGLYSLLKDPWLVLPIELLHGFTYAVFYAACTGFANVVAPPGTEATVLGLLCGIFEGLGIAFGSFLGGLGFSKIGGSQTFFIAACFSVICVPLNFVSHTFFNKTVNKSISTSDMPGEKKA